MIAVLLMLLGCSLPGRVEPAAPTGGVEVRLVGGDAAVTSLPCGQGAAAVWVDGRSVARRPGRALISWQPCGPVPALSVLPPSSTVVLRNDGAAPLSLQWRQDGGQPQTVQLAVGGERRLELGRTGRLTVSSPTDRAVVVASTNGGLTDGQGRASLAAVASGTTQIHVLHPLLGDRDTTVNVPEGDSILVEVELPRLL